MGVGWRVIPADLQPSSFKIDFCSTDVSWYLHLPTLPASLL